MSADIMGCAGFALEVVHFAFTLIHLGLGARRRSRRIERFRSLKVWGLEWTTYECEDDRQS